MRIEDIALEDLQKGNPALVEAIRSSAREAVMKELEEKIKKGEAADKAILSANKARILAEAGFVKEVAEKVGKLIEAEAISLELAESIVKSHKELIEKAPPAGAPKVAGHGGGSGSDDEVKLPTDEQLAEAVENA